MPNALKRNLKAGATQKVSYTASAGTGSAIGSYITTVRVVCTTAAYVAFNKTATTSDTYVPAGLPEYFEVDAGAVPSAIRVSADGDLYVTDMSL